MMMGRAVKPTITYYYTVISGFAYLGEPELERIVQAADAAVVYKPVDIAKVFSASETTAPARQSPARRRYRDIELQRWAAIRGLAIKTAPKHWPVPAAAASQAVIASQALGLDPHPLSFAFLRAVWAEDRNISDLDTVREIVMSTRPDAAARILDAAAKPETAAAFAAATEEAIANGVFGSPTYFINGEMFFGQDRLELVASKLGDLQ